MRLLAFFLAVSISTSSFAVDEPEQQPKVCVKKKKKPVTQWLLSAAVLGASGLAAGLYYLNQNEKRQKRDYVLIFINHGPHTIGREIQDVFEQYRMIGYRVHLIEKTPFNHDQMRQSEFDYDALLQTEFRTSNDLTRYLVFEINPRIHLNANQTHVHVSQYHFKYRTHIIGHYMVGQNPFCRSTMLHSELLFPNTTEHAVQVRPTLDMTRLSGLDLFVFIQKKIDNFEQTNPHN